MEHDDYRRRRPAAMMVDYSRKVSMPIRDMFIDGAPIVCAVDVYGVTPRDLAVIPGGAEPMMKAVERLGLDPNRYQSMLWDIPI